MPTDKNKSNPDPDRTHAKVVATKKRSGGYKAGLKVRGGSGSTTGLSTSRKN